MTDDRVINVFYKRKIYMKYLIRILIFERIYVKNNYAATNLVITKEILTS